MLPGDAGIVQIDVRRLVSGPGCSPSGSGAARRAVWQAQLAPVLRRVGNPTAESGPPGTGSARPAAGNRKRTTGHIPRPPPADVPPAGPSGCPAAPAEISMGPPPLLKHNCIVCYYSIFSGKCTALPSPASFHWGGAAGGICAGFPEVSAFFSEFLTGNFPFTLDLC